MAGRVIAGVGRRVDPPDAAEPRFPAGVVPRVTELVRGFLHEQGARAVVGSAACGADLILHGVAGELGLARRVVLPFDPARFRATSVVDRPGDWGERYDRLLHELGPRDLVILGLPEGDYAYARTNEAILDEADRLDGGIGARAALLIWNGRSRGPGDLTAHFAEAARGRGFDVHEIPTI